MSLGLNIRRAGLCAILGAAFTLASLVHAGAPTAGRVDGSLTPVHHRRLSNGERREIERLLPPGATIARMPLSYVRKGDRIYADINNIAAASLFGDVDGDGKNEFVVGCLFKSQEPPSGLAPGTPVAPGAMMKSDLPRDDRARLVVFKRGSTGHWTRFWTSPGLGYKFDIPKHNIDEIGQGIETLADLRTPISLADVDGDGALEIVYYAWSEDEERLGALPGIYRWDGSRWGNIAPQGDRFSVRDLDQDGKLEVLIGSRYVGYSTGNDDVPRVYRWNGRRYNEASAEFPGYFADLARRYKRAIEQFEAHGEDYEKTLWDRAIQQAENRAKMGVAG